MHNKNLKLPALILAIGLVLCLVAHLAVSVLLTPTVTAQDFSYSVTYQLNGETKTLNGIYRCKFDGFSGGEDPYERCYSGEYIIDGQTSPSHTYTVAEKDGAQLYIVTLFNEAYLMGDTKHLDYGYALQDPFLEAVDKEGYAYDGTQMPAEFTSEIISWEYPQPIENTFVFSGFTILHYGSLLVMAAIGLLAIVACLIFVKKEEAVSYKVLDKISIFVNFAACFFAIPFISVCTAFLLLVMDNHDVLYQIYLCVPALTALGVAASIALRRKGYTKTGFFVQFIGPALFFVPIVLEAIIFNLSA